MSTKKAEDMTMDAYVREGERKAYEIGNRGPIRLNADGTLHEEIADAYWRCGFYVFEGALNAEELKDLQADFERVLDQAPYTKDAEVDSKGRPALGLEFTRSSFNFAKPLSDPVGGTSRNNGRHPAKMDEPTPPEDAPDFVITSVSGPLQLMDSCLRLYGHPQLLAVAEHINGPDFTPFTESIIVKPPGLGASVAWHQDGTKQWDKPDWDQGTHGFNFMAQLYGSTAANGVWVLPGSHKEGQLDIKAMVEANNSSDRLPGAVPMVCEPGDVVMSNRQALHASFPNTSPNWRVTVNFGFHRYSSVIGLETTYGEEPVVYDAERIFERARLIAVGVDARQERFPHEQRYVYQPMVGKEDDNRWNDVTRKNIVKDYNLRDLGI
jgi:hypothetical protein